MAQRAVTFRDLRVYRNAFRLQQEIFRVSRLFPDQEKYSLTSQIRRSSRSIGGNITEAWQKRRYAAHFVSKLTDSDAKNAETQHWLHTAHSCDYILRETCDELTRSSNEIGAMLGKMINDPDSLVQIVVATR